MDHAHLTEVISNNSQYIVFVVIYVILNLGSVRSLLDGHANVPFIHHRAPKLLVLQSLFNAGIVTSAILGAFFVEIRVPISCSATLWLMGIFIPGWIFCRLATTLHLVSIFSASAATLEHEVSNLNEPSVKEAARRVVSGISFFGPGGEEQNAEESRASIEGLVLIRKLSSYEAKKQVHQEAIEVVDSISDKSFGSAYWFLTNRNFFSQGILIVFVLLSMVVRVVIMLIISLIYRDNSHLEASSKCFKSPLHYSVLSMNAVSLFLLLLVFIYQFLRVKENLGVEKETFLVFLASFVYFLSFSMFFIPWKSEIRCLLCFIYFTVAVFPFIQIVSIGFPAWQLRNNIGSEQDLKKEALVQLLSQPSGMQQFKDFARNEFSVENVLFYQRCLALEKSTSSAQKQDRIKKIYLLHCTSYSPFLLNLVQNTLKKINSLYQKALSDGQSIPENIFDEAREEVLNLMYKDTYPRFIRDQRSQQELEVKKWDQFAQRV